jgi:hypothetical protein
MAAPAIPPIRRGLMGTGLAVGKPTGVDAEQVAAFLASLAGQPNRTFVGENFFHRNDLRYARAPLDPVPGTGPVPPRRPRGSTGTLDVLPGKHFSSSASFAV